MNKGEEGDTLRIVATLQNPSFAFKQCSRLLKCRSSDVSCVGFYKRAVRHQQTTRLQQKSFTPFYQLNNYDEQSSPSFDIALLIANCRFRPHPRTIPWFVSSTTDWFSTLFDLRLYYYQQPFFRLKEPLTTPRAMMNLWVD